MFKKKNTRETKKINYGDIHYKCDEKDDFTSIKGSLFGLMNGLSNIIGSLLNAGVPEYLIKMSVETGIDCHNRKKKKKKSNFDYECDLDFDGDISELIKGLLNEDE